MLAPARLLLLPALAWLLAGCAADDAGFPYFFVTVTADWPDAAASASGLGYAIDVTVTKKLDGNGDCGKIPGGVRVLVDGAELSFAPDSGAGCLEAKPRLGPFLQDHVVTVTLEQDGQTKGEATFADLMPGLAAALVSPPGGQVRAGDDIVIRPVPALPTGWGNACFLPLDGAGTVSALCAPNQRGLDGVHVQAPVFTGRAWLIVRTPDSAPAAVTCAGFALCHGQAASVLGPLLVTEVP